MVWHQLQETLIFQGHRQRHKQTLVGQLIRPLREPTILQEHLLQRAHHPVQLIILIVRAVHLRITIIHHRIQAVAPGALIQHLRAQVVQTVVQEIQVVALADQAVQVALTVDVDNCIFQSY